MIEIARKRTKIVATIGPASRDPKVLRAMVAVGSNVARLNFSHGNHAEHAATIETVRNVSSELKLHVAVLQDLPGPKVRTGSLAPGSDSVQLRVGQPFALLTEPIAGSAQAVSVNYAGLPQDVEIGKRLYLADGAIALRITAKTVDSSTPSLKPAVRSGSLKSRTGEGSIRPASPAAHDVRRGALAST